MITSLSILTGKRFARSNILFAERGAGRRRRSDGGCYAATAMQQLANGGLTLPFFNLALQGHLRVVYALRVRLQR
jgi:hypothetical protein